MVADDPSMHSSQNEQDSRFYLDSPIFHVMSLQTSKRLMIWFDAFELSEIPFACFNETGNPTCPFQSANKIQNR